MRGGDAAMWTGWGRHPARLQRRDKPPASGENGPGRVLHWTERGESGTGRYGDAFPLSRDDPDASREALGRGNSSNRPRITTPVLRSGGTHMGQRRSKLDRHATELLALRWAGATVAELGRWLEKAHVRNMFDIDVADNFDAVAALDELRARDRELRFPRPAGSCIDEHGYRVLRWRREGATIRRVPPSAPRPARLRVHRSTVSRWLRKHANGEA